jgi:hypothetical protein
MAAVLLGAPLELLTLVQEIERAQLRSDRTTLEEARGEIQRALDLFAKEPEDAPWPNCRRAEIHASLGPEGRPRGRAVASRPGARAGAFLRKGEGSAPS